MSLIELFRRRRIDGLLLGPCENEDTLLIERVGRECFPDVDRDLGPTATGLHVGLFNGAIQMTSYLLDLGHKRVALMTSESHLRPGRERIDGFTAAFAHRGLAPDSKLVPADCASMEFAFSQALSLLSLKELPTALICLGTRVLPGALQGLRHAGRSVPDDVSVISVGDTDLLQLVSPPNTDLSWDLQAVGEALAELLSERLLAGAQPGSWRIVIATRLMQREICGPVHARASNRSKKTDTKNISTVRSAAPVLK